MWTSLHPRLSDTRVEIVTGVREATAIPWELLRDPQTGAVLTLRARAFVRTYAQPESTAKYTLDPAASGPIRILLVISRPAADDDVPFRSVAGRLIKGLDEAARETFQLDVLRPPTFERLGKTLRQAKNKGQPYHIVHFDGHGVYTEAPKSDTGWLAELLSGLTPMLLSAPRSGPHGYLLFENPDLDQNIQLVDGPPWANC